jgi:hypothetical protein
MPMPDEPQCVHCLVPFTLHDTTVYLPQSNRTVHADSLRAALAARKTVLSLAEYHWLHFWVIEGQGMPIFMGSFGPNDLWSELPFWQVWSAANHVDLGVLTRNARMWHNRELQHEEEYDNATEQ